LALNFKGSVLNICNHIGYTATVPEDFFYLERPAPNFSLLQKLSKLIETHRK